jgi:hypothetical protein
MNLPNKLDPKLLPSSVVLIVPYVILPAFGARIENLFTNMYQNLKPVGVSAVCGLEELLPVLKVIFVGFFRLLLVLPEFILETGEVILLFLDLVKHLVPSKLSYAVYLLFYEF